MQVSGLLDLRTATKIARSLDSFEDVEIELCLFDSLINVIARWGYKVPDSHEFDITLPETFVIIFTRHSEGREQINTQV